MKHSNSFTIQQNSNFGPQHNDQSYKLYWSFLDNCYFREIKEDEIKLLEHFSNQIFSNLPQSTKPSPQKTISFEKTQNSHLASSRKLNGAETDSESSRFTRKHGIPDGSVPQIEAYVKKLIKVNKLANSFPSMSGELAEMNYENLLKQITLSLSTSPLICFLDQKKSPEKKTLKFERSGSEPKTARNNAMERLKNDSAFEKLFEEKYSFNPWRRPPQNLQKVLSFETQVLDSMLQKKWIKNFRKDRQSNEISDQIGFLAEELKQINQGNRQVFTEFQNQIRKSAKNEEKEKTTKGRSGVWPISENSNEFLSLENERSKSKSKNNRKKEYFLF